MTQLISTKTVLVLCTIFMCLGLSTQAQHAEKEQIMGEWKFVEITLKSPKTGYVPAFQDKEIGFMRICMANYNFNQDGSMSLSERYMKNNGANSASWVLEGETINITYNFNEDTPGHTNKSETLPWTIVSVSEDTLTIDLMGLFTVKLEK